MDDLVERLARGNVTEVKVVLTSVVLALAGAFHAVVIVAVTLQLGPTSAAELESREERQDQRLDQQEERREDRQDRRED